MCGICVCPNFRPTPRSPRPSAAVKRIDEPCQVKTRPDRPLPYLFKWRGETWEVRQVVEVWRLQSKWWAEDGPERRTFYRCVTHDGTSGRGGNTVVELYRRTVPTRQEWVLARLAD